MGGIRGMVLSNKNSYINKLQLPTPDRALLDTCKLTTVIRMSRGSLGLIEHRPHALLLLELLLVLLLLLDTRVPDALLAMRCETLVLCNLVANLSAPVIADDLLFDDLSTLLGSLCVCGCPIRLGLLLRIAAGSNHIVVAVLVFEVIILWTEGLSFIA